MRSQDLRKYVEVQDDAVTVAGAHLVEQLPAAHMWSNGVHTVPVWVATFTALCGEGNEKHKPYPCKVSLNGLRCVRSGAVAVEGTPMAISKRSAFGSTVQL